MDALKELVMVVTKHSVKSLKTINSSKGSRVYELYEKIAANELETDAQAAKYFFNSTPQHPQYRKLKNRLEELLLNSVVFIDTNSPKFSDTQRAFYTCQRYMTISKILLGRTARKPAVKLFEKVLKYAERLELCEPARDAAIGLRDYHAYRTGNVREFEKYLNLSRKYTEIWQAEDLAQQYFQEYSVSSIKSVPAEREQRFKSTMSKLRPYLKNITSYRLHFLVYLLETNHYSETNTYSKLLKSANEASTFFKSKPIAPIALVAIFKVRQLEAYIGLDDFENGRKVFRQCDRQIEPGVVHWYNSYELYMLLLFRTKKYHSLSTIFEKATQHPAYKHQTTKRHERFRIFQAFIYYLSLLDRVKLGVTKDFRLQRFLNELPIHSQDKRGYNVTVLMIQILILIQSKQHDKLTDRIEAIEKYTSRYLRNDENFRSNCFIKMLLQVPKRNFHKVAVLRHAKPYIEKLATVPLLKSKQSYEIEIIPYEHLWEYVLESLEAGQIKEPS